MAKHWRFFIFLLWTSYLIVSGILLFTHGFLLTREAFTDVSSCIPPSDIPCTPAASSSNNITNGHEFHCSYENKLSSMIQDVNSASKLCFPSDTKVILLIIDALRYDFTTFDEELYTPLAYQNNLPIINTLLKKHPEKTRLFKFIADPPTTTMQRLKALTTGSLPTFIDAGSNFATPEINEDNIIDQLVHHNKNIIFMGDDTWAGLYPKRFKRSWNFPSFNVWDLDTVDKGILEKIYSELPREDWHLFIAHFLGVDHCGHRYGPFHNEMKRKLTEMNDVIKKIVDTMDKNTMLFVIGDHGMTSTGDHGGDSDAEITSAMFVYSSNSLHNINPVDTIRQIDLIPTLSTVLGIPIPFSNLGTVVLNALPVLDSKFRLNNWQSSLLSLWYNIEQANKYITTYSERTKEFSKSEIELLSYKYNHLKDKVNNIKSDLQLQYFVKDATNYLTHVRNMCEEVWVQFDSFSMSRGLLLLFLTLFFTYLIIDGIPITKLTKILMSSFIIFSYIVIFIIAIANVVLYYFSLINNLQENVLFSTGMVSVFLLTVLVIQHWEDIAINWYDNIKFRSWIDTICRVILILVLCTLFSNSYIIEEAGVFSYLLITLIVVIIYSTNNSNQTKAKSHDKSQNSFKIRWGSIKFKLIAMALCVGILLRISMYYWRYREEQKWYVNVITNENMNMSKTNDMMSCIVSLVFLALFATVTRIWLRSCGNLVGFSSTVTLTRYAPTVIVVCTSGFWILHRLPKETKNRIITPWQTDVLAWIVYFLISVSVVCAVIQPLCIYVLPKKKETVSVYGQENIIPQLFNHVKETIQEKKIKSGTKETPIVCGLATVYSALYVIVSIFISLLIALLLGNILAPSTVIMYFTVALVLGILSIAQYEKSTKIAQVFNIPNSSILCWMLLSLYFFYGTGHQPTFPSIQWSAAFVGTGGTFVHNTIPAILVGLNTFGSFILMGLSLPLLIIAPFTIYVMFPMLCNKQHDKDMAKGELLLYEHEDSTYNSLYIISCKYIMCHGIRMFACMLATTIHCRHLMVWKVFAPKLIFEAIGLLVTLPCVLLGYLLFIRINSRVDKLVVSLEKQNRLNPLI